MYHIHPPRNRLTSIYIHETELLYSFVALHKEYRMLMKMQEDMLIVLLKILLYQQLLQKAMK